MWRNSNFFVYAEMAIVQDEKIVSTAFIMAIL